MIKYVAYAVITLAFVLALPRASLASSDTTMDNLTITFVNCTSNVGRILAPRMIIGTLRQGLGTGARTIYLGKRRAERIGFFRQRLAPGSYAIFVGYGDCGDELVVQLLPMHDRHIVMVGSGAVTLDYPEGAIAGVLPDAGFVASIVYDDRSGRPEGRCRGEAVPATTEGDAYYAVGLAGGHACLRLSNQRRTTWHDFDIGSFSRFGGHEHSAKIYNVTATMLDECARVSDKRITYTYGAGPKEINDSVQPVCNVQKRP